MALPSAQLRNLVLKRREDEQNDLQSFSLLRIPKSYIGLAQSGIGQVCVIYVPTRGMLSMPSIEAHYIASALLKEIIADPHDASKVLLTLDRVERFTAPVPFQIDGFLPETGEEYGRRDRSLEQKYVRAIAVNNLQRLLRLGSAPFSLFDKSDNITLEPQNAEQSTGFSEDDRVTRQIKAAERARSSATPIVRSRYVRLKSRLLDKRTCVVTGFNCTLDNVAVGISVAHIRGLANGGDDSLTNTLTMAHLIHDLFDRFGFTFEDNLQI